MSVIAEAWCCRLNDRVCYAMEVFAVGLDTLKSEVVEQQLNEPEKCRETCCESV